MGSTKKVGPAGIFGPRYGTLVRKQYAEVVSQLRRRHECPRCHVKAVRRVSIGIWLCLKCGVKFAGGSYVPFTKLGEMAKRSVKGVTAPVTKPIEARVPEETPESKEAPRKRRRREREEKPPEEGGKE